MTKPIRKFWKLSTLLASVIVILVLGMGFLGWMLYSQSVVAESQAKEQAWRTSFATAYGAGGNVVGFAPVDTSVVWTSLGQDGKQYVHISLKTGNVWTEIANAEIKNQAQSAQPSVVPIPQSQSQQQQVPVLPLPAPSSKPIEQPKSEK